MLIYTWLRFYFIHADNNKNKWILLLCKRVFSGGEKIFLRAFLGSNREICTLIEGTRKKLCRLLSGFRARKPWNFSKFNWCLKKGYLPQTAEEGNRGGGENRADEKGAGGGHLKGIIPRLIGGLSVARLHPLSSLLSTFDGETPRVREDSSFELRV